MNTYIIFEIFLIEQSKCLEKLKISNDEWNNVMQEKNSEATAKDIRKIVKDREFQNYRIKEEELLKYSRKQHTPILKLNDRKSYETHKFIIFIKFTYGL